METKFKIVIIITVLFFQSCEEKDVLINFEQQKNVADSTYVAAVEKPQNRNVLIEEFTGASCVNCPLGHQTVASLISSNPDRIVAIAYHTFNGGSVFKPVNKSGIKSKYDFRDTAATDISTIVFGGVNSIPIAGIDRIPFSGSMQIPRTQWALQTNNRLKEPSPVNLYLTSLFNIGENKVIVKIKVVYVEEVLTKNILTIGVTESGILDAQEFPTYIDTAYTHNHIFRKCLTPFNGNSVLDSLSTKAAGRVYEYNFTFTPDLKWKLENCHIVAILSTNEPNNKEVLQAKEVKLK